MNLSLKISNSKILNGLCFGLFLLMYSNNGRNPLVHRVISGSREVDAHLINSSFGRFEFPSEKIMAKKVLIDVNAVLNDLQSS